ncbi:MAG: hypothetical protein ACPGAM_08885 [Candidatus Puniceispirillaceae bacterium]
MRHTTNLPAPHNLSAEDQSEWIRLMKAWEAEHPLDKAAKNPKGFGLMSGSIMMMLTVFVQGFDASSPRFEPLLAIPFGYLIYYLTNRRYVKWDSERRAYSDQLVQSLYQAAEEIEDD